MKTRTLPLLLLMVTFYWTLPAQIYVNANATGANTGHSWIDAFTSFQDALDAANEGDEIWVAAGTYRPGGLNSNPAACFPIDKNLQLLGGFSGTEASAEERDPATHLTILSGDLNGDDISNDFANNRMDNAHTVVAILEPVTNAALLDGFIIRGGHAGGTGAEIAQAGGGIYCLGAPVIRQCVLEQNYARANGGALYLEGINASGIRIENCHFTNNRAYDSTGSIGRGGAIYARDVREAGVQIATTTIDHNTAEFTAGISLYNSKAILEDVNITGNTALMQGGGLWFFSNNVDDLSLVMTGGAVNNNESSFGGGMYFIVTGDNCSIALNNMTLAGNAAVPLLNGWQQGGGAVRMLIAENASNASISIDGCEFTGNNSTGDGGALGVLLAAEQATFQLRNSQFTDNAAGIFGAAHIWGLANGSGNVTVENCLFKNNTALHAAGLSIGSEAAASLFDNTVTGCSFLQNTALGNGGALELWGETTTTFLVDSCTFEANAAGQSAGALLLTTNHQGFNANVRNCKFKFNSSPFGAAFASLLPTSGGSMTGEAAIRLENSLFTENSGDKATIALRQLGNVQLLNCNVVENLAGSILLDSDAGASIQNTIFYNPGFTEFRNPTGTGTFLSQGGNLVADNSLAGWLTETDLQGEDPLFAGPGNFQLTAGSPCIDAGITAGVTTDFDLAGNPRVQGTQVDIGAYESSFVTGSREAIKDNFELDIFPNPAADHVFIQVPRYTGEQLNVSLYDGQGRLISRQMIYGHRPYELQDLTPGMYFLKLENKRRLHTGKFIVE